MSLTKEQRKALPDTQFAVPGKRKLPIHDAAHTRLAWDMVERTADLTSDERDEARKLILHSAKELGLETTDWTGKSIAGSATLSWLSAMAIEMPEVLDHPNRMPFSGVLTFVDQPSDEPPGGSSGKRTWLSSKAANEMLPSLLGMGVDFTAELDGHDAQQKIGVITSAEVVGDELRIAGFFYAADFPQVCARIKEEKEDLGFSFEMKAQTLPMVGNLLQIVGGMFTGAAVLYKDKAAYQRTSLAAQATQELEMTPEEMKKMFGEVIAPLAASIEAQGKRLETVEKVAIAAAKTQDIVKPHIDRLRECAASMEASGIGAAGNTGHVAVLNRMANSMEKEAIDGKIPHVYRDHDFMYASANGGKDADLAASIQTAVDAALKPLKDELAVANTKVADLTAKAATAATQPERQTVPANVVTLLAKHGLTDKVDDKGKISVEVLDKTLSAAGMDRQARMATKLRLQQEGVLA